MKRRRTSAPVLRPLTDDEVAAMTEALSALRRRLELVRCGRESVYVGGYDTDVKKLTAAEKHFNRLLSHVIHTGVRA